MGFTLEEMHWALTTVQQYLSQQKQLGSAVETVDVALVHFSLPGAFATMLPDLNLGFLLKPKALGQTDLEFRGDECADENRQRNNQKPKDESNKKRSTKKWFVLALKPPWTGIYFTEVDHFWPSSEPPHAAWRRSFGADGPLLYDALKGDQLVGIDVHSGDRAFRLHFVSGASLLVELFTTRPNWYYLDQTRQKILQWRESKAAPKSEVSAKRSLRTMPLQWMNEQYVLGLKLRQEWLLNQKREQALKGVKEKIGQLERQLKIHEESLRKSAHWKNLQDAADEFKARLYQLDPNKACPAQVTLSGGEVLKLYETMTPSENLQALYEKVKKLKRTALNTKERIEQTTRKISQWRALYSKVLRHIHVISVEEKDFKEDLDFYSEVIRQTAGGSDLKSKLTKKEKTIQKQGLSPFYSNERMRIWVGRNHSENEEIVMKLARGNDVWLHLKGLPGAHGIIQIPKGKTASLDTLLDAAHLVAHYSKVAFGERIEVDYTFRKNVKRISGKSSGKNPTSSFNVHYIGNKTLYITVDESRVRRLQASRNES